VNRPGSVKEDTSFFLLIIDLRGVIGCVSNLIMITPVISNALLREGLGTRVPHDCA
jgi:hypothetical protein